MLLPAECGDAVSLAGGAACGWWCYVDNLVGGRFDRRNNELVMMQGSHEASISAASQRWRLFVGNGHWIGEVGWHQHVARVKQGVPVRAADACKAKYLWDIFRSMWLSSKRSSRGEEFHVGGGPRWTPVNWWRRGIGASDTPRDWC
jgi:hypothetical protein